MESTIDKSSGSPTFSVVIVTLKWQLSTRHWARHPRPLQDNNQTRFGQARLWRDLECHSQSLSRHIYSFRFYFNWLFNFFLPDRGAYKKDCFQLPGIWAVRCETCGIIWYQKLILTGHTMSKQYYNPVWLFQVNEVMLDAGNEQAVIHLLASVQPGSLHLKLALKCVIIDKPKGFYCTR